MNYFNTILIAVLLLLTGCGEKDPPVSNMQVHFTPMWGSDTLVLNKNNVGDDSKKFRFSKIKMYWSHIRFVKSDGSEVEVSPVVLVDLENPISLQVPVSGLSGSFTGLNFGIGLDSIQNQTDPKTVAKTSPLHADNNTWWANTGNFVFAEIEGQADTGAVMPANVFWNFLFHSGTNPLYKQVSLTKNFSFDASKQNVVALQVDMKKIFYAQPNAIDIKTEYTTSTTDNPVLAKKFIEKMITAFEIK